MFLTGLGSTETAPYAIGRTFESKRAANVGLPGPEVEAKLVPNDGKLELRLRGPNILPGYWRDPELTKNAFDEEGFYRIGDAVAFEDPNDPSKGLLFDGRIAEDFKLSTGTWVSTGRLRARIIDFFSPYVNDVVLTGPDRIDLGALIFPDIEACRALAGGVVGDAAAVLTHPKVAAEFKSRLAGIRQASDRRVDARRPHHADGRAAVDGCRRGHRQGLDQSAQCAASSRRCWSNELYRSPRPPAS